LKTIPYPVGSTGSTVNLPAPANPGMHNALYSAVFIFDLGIGVLQIVILVLRLIVRSPIRRIAETVGNLIFWFGAAILVNIFLLAGTLTSWFQYWAALIALVGVSIIARGLIHLSKG
jgi:hypothetical protein